MSCKPAPPPEAAAHFTPVASAESAVRTKPSVPTAIRAAVSSAEPTIKSPLASIRVSEINVPALTAFHAAPSYTYMLEAVVSKYNAPVISASPSLSVDGAELFWPRYRSSKLSNAVAAEAAEFAAETADAAALVSDVEAFDAEVDAALAEAAAADSEAAALVALVEAADALDAALLALVAAFDADVAAADSEAAAATALAAALVSDVPALDSLVAAALSLAAAAEAEEAAAVACAVAATTCDVTPVSTKFFVAAS